jgi:23S rRNA (adenine2503-C2)-methyltransferase
MRLPLTPPAQTAGIFGLEEPSLAVAIASMGERKYRATQLCDWLYDHNVESFEAMENLPKKLRARLAERFHIYESTVVADHTAQDETRKLLLRWADGNTSECVLIPDEKRRTACISTQVGCPVGCRFCASGLDGLARQLTAAQMVEQVMRIRGLCVGRSRLSNVVFMGLGEPLANYRNTVKALRVINSEKCVYIGARRITVSTVGLPEQMRRLAGEGLQVTLALSLHAPTDELRRELIPWAERVTIAELVSACAYYFERTGREVTLEYVLLGGVNDQPEHARKLAELCRDMRANVNLIRYNPVVGVPYGRPTSEAAQTFLEILRERGVNTHLRRSRGLDIDSACGQLRRRIT